MGKDGKVNNLLIPNVSKLPKHRNVDASKKLTDPTLRDEFKNLLKEEVGEAKAKHGINLSIHAARRLKERNLSLNTEDFFKLKSGIDKLKTKGGQDSLIITDKAAYIVDVNNNTIVTAMDKNDMADNVFTKIDSTLVLN